MRTDGKPLCNSLNLQLVWNQLSFGIKGMIILKSWVGKKTHQEKRSSCLLIHKRHASLSLDIIKKYLSNRGLFYLQLVTHICLVWSSLSFNWSSVRFMQYNMDSNNLHHAASFCYDSGNHVKKTVLNGLCTFKNTLTASTRIKSPTAKSWLKLAHGTVIFLILSTPKDL